MPAVLALHPEAVPGDPATLRWVVPPGRVPVRGRLEQAPGALGELLRDGTLTAVQCGPAEVSTTLGGGRSWAGEGARVRTALQSALTEPDAWVAQRSAPGAGETGRPGERPTERPGERPFERPGEQPGDDAAVRAGVQAVLDGPAGQYVRSHGGGVELVDVSDGVVQLRLSGACRHCPISPATLHLQLERRIREQVPGVLDVREAPKRGFAPVLRWRGSRR